jgi:predicted patatin/cPLA2 family phospholipase
MDMEKTALVLEGGGLRGVYTSGVLRFFADKGISFPYVIGVSMGACNAANYVSRQPERNRIVNIRYVNDTRYISYLRLLTRGELFGMQFIFETIPRLLVPFDFKTFMGSDVQCVTVVTDCVTGKALYFEKRELGDDYLKVLQASSSLPFLAKPILYRGRALMDGGLSDAIPVGKSIDDGYRRNVLVLTRPKGYRKGRSRLAWLAHFGYPRYKGLCRALARRYLGYNRTMDFIDLLEQRGEAFVIRPQRALRVRRAERDKEKLYAAYDQGYYDASARYGQLRSFLEPDFSPQAAKGRRQPG